MTLAAVSRLLRHASMYYYYYYTYTYTYIYTYTNSQSFHTNK